MIYPRVRTKITPKQIHIHNTQSTERTTKRPQSFYQRKDNKNMHQPLCIDYPNVTSGIRELSAKTYIKWINTIPHCYHEYSIARHISSVLKSIKVFNPITTKSQREKLNSSQQDREGKTPYDPTILTKPVIHQDRDWYVSVVSIIFDCSMPILYNFRILFGNFLYYFRD